jgi:hypothetical protein
MNDNVLPLPVKSILLDDASKKFTKWLESAAPGDKYCYHTGVSITGNSQVAKTAFKAFEKGSITLYQKRNGTIFEYYAVKRKWR